LTDDNVVSIETRAPIEQPAKPKRNAVAIVRLCVEAFGWFMLFGLCVALV
jgi:hypothetical protein